MSDGSGHIIKCDKHDAQDTKCLRCHLCGAREPSTSGEICLSCRITIRNKK